MSLQLKPHYWKHYIFENINLQVSFTFILQSPHHFCLADRNVSFLDIIFYFILHVLNESVCTKLNSSFPSCLPAFLFLFSLFSPFLLPTLISSFTSLFSPSLLPHYFNFHRQNTNPYPYSCFPSHYIWFFFSKIFTTAGVLYNSSVKDRSCCFIKCAEENILRNC